MLTKLFKLVTSLVLIAALSFLVIKRDIYLNPKKLSPPTQSERGEAREPFEKNPKSIQAISQDHSQNTQATLPEVTQQETSKDISTSPQSIGIATTSKKVPVLAVPSVTKSNATSNTNPYITMVKGSSDSEEFYKPTVSPCVTSMGYKIGTFDNHFGISKNLFIQEIDNASSLWGDAINKNLFYYNENGSLTINLIYDERQARTEDLGYLALDIDNAKKSAENLRQTYEQEKIEYKKAGEILNKDTDDFQIQYKAYGDKVTKYNSEGGAPRDVYESMQQELAALKQEVSVLEARRTALLTEMDSINRKIEKYNEFITYINSLVAKGNALGGVKFTEGKFSPRNNTIDIYEYSDNTKLRRVLTHELGHALGIDHNDNVYSIMYSVNSATTTALSKEDVRDLVKICSNK